MFYLEYGEELFKLVYFLVFLVIILNELVKCN